MMMRKKAETNFNVKLNDSSVGLTDPVLFELLFVVVSFRTICSILRL